MAYSKIKECSLKSNVPTKETDRRSGVVSRIIKDTVVDWLGSPIFDLERELAEAIARNDLGLEVHAIEGEAENVVRGPRVEPDVFCLDPVLLCPVC